MLFCPIARYITQLFVLYVRLFEAAVLPMRAERQEENMGDCQINRFFFRGERNLFKTSTEMYCLYAGFFFFYLSTLCDFSSQHTSGKLIYSLIPRSVFLNVGGMASLGEKT